MKINIFIRLLTLCLFQIVFVTEFERIVIKLIFNTKGVCLEILPPTPDLLPGVRGPEFRNRDFKSEDLVCVCFGAVSLVSSVLALLIMSS